jgi:hypothetical protein
MYIDKKIFYQIKDKIIFASRSGPKSSWCRAARGPFCGRESELRTEKLGEEDSPWSRSCRLGSPYGADWHTRRALYHPKRKSTIETPLSHMRKNAL